MLCTVYHIIGCYGFIGAYGSINYHATVSVNNVMTVDHSGRYLAKANILKNAIVNLENELYQKILDNFPDLGKLSKSSFVWQSISLIQFVDDYYVRPS